ncbi:hypothetical protein [Microcella sp.]|uniref:hypothetical protein n=1 Tax=Microcella sp. TaxID=1913979 RepID=UPI00256B62B8|nr:HAD family hydrolase [Microcella sp.]
MMADRLLILDFDGTLCLGDGPVRAFAREVASTAGAAAVDLLDPLDRFLQGELGTPFEGCADAYTAVATWARERGLERGAMTAAFLRGRAELDAGHIEISTPDGVIDRLGAMQGWHRVLVTNSPLASTVTLTARLGLDTVLDTIIGDAAKPGGLEALLAPGGDLDARRWSRVVSLGDIWINDLAPVHAVRGETGLIERHPQPQAVPTWRAGNVQALLHQI